MKVTVHKQETTRPLKALLVPNEGSLIFPTGFFLQDIAKSVYISGKHATASLRYDKQLTLEEDLKLNSHFVPLYEGDSITITF